MIEMQIQIAKSKIALRKWDESQHPRDDDGMWTATGVSASRLGSGGRGAKADPFGDAKFRSVQGSLPRLGSDADPRVTAVIAAEEEKRQEESNAAVLASIVGLMIDASQTSTIASKPGQYYEKNPLLGPHPSASAVNLFFAAQAFGKALLTFAPPQVKGPIALVDLLQRIPAIGGNYGIGLR